MNKSIIDFIPEEFRDMKLSELFDFDRNDNAIYQKKNNKINMKVIKNNMVFSLGVEDIQISDIVSKTTTKEKLVDQVIALRKEGMLQKDIAEILHVSQSYVSALLKTYDFEKEYLKEKK